MFRFASCLLAASLALTPQLAHAQGKVTSQDKKAAEHMGQGRWLEAAQVLRELVTTAPTATRLFNLAQAERNLGALADAKLHFTQALERAKQEKLPPVANAAEASLGDLEGKVPQLSVEITPPVNGVEVRIDGRIVELDANGSLEVNPGRRQLMVIAPGYENYERSLTPRIGDRVEVQVELVAKDSAAGAGSTSGGSGEATGGIDTGVPGPSSGPPMASIILGGVGIAAALGGGFFFLQAQSKFSDAEDVCPCNSNDPDIKQKEAEFNDLVDQGQTSRVVGGVLLGVGGAAIGTAAVLWVLNEQEKDSARRRRFLGASGLRFGFTPLPGGGQAVFSAPLF